MHNISGHGILMASLMPWKIRDSSADMQSHEVLNVADDIHLAQEAVGW